MTPTKKQTSSSGGFAIAQQPDTELGLAMLIAEDEEGGGVLASSCSSQFSSSSKSPSARVCVDKAAAQEIEFDVLDQSFC
jgi:hypothetical protein